MQTEIMTATKNELMMAPEGAWGTEGVLSNDLILPRLMLMQALSKFVSDDNVGAKAGEIRDSVEGKLLGNTKSPAKIIPFFSTTTWVVNKEVNGKFEFHKIESRREGERREYEVIVEGTRYRNSACINLYCLSYDDVKTGMVTPYEVNLKSFSFKYAGRSFTQLASKLKGNNKSLASAVFELGVKKEENDKGSFYAYTMSLAKDADGKVHFTTPEEQAMAYQQYKQIYAAYADNRLKMNTEDEEVSSTASESIPF